MQFGKKKQKLILNRVKRHQVFSKCQGQYQSKIQTYFKSQNVNIINIQNSSNHPNGKQNLIRCRSIQSLCNQRTLQKHNSQNRISLPIHSSVRRQVQFLSQETVSQLTSKLKWDNRSKEDEMANRNLLIQFAQKIMDKVKSKPAEQRYKQKKMKICKAISLSTEQNRQRQLSIHSNMQLHLQIERANIYLDLQNQQKELILLSNQHRYLKKQISQQQTKITTLATQIQQLNLKLTLKTNQLKSIQDQINKQNDYLTRFQQQLRGMTVFMEKQANNELQMQVNQYKSSQQELFNFAFLLDQTSLNKYTHTLSNIIIACNEAFKQSLQSCSGCQTSEEQADTIFLEDWPTLKKNITNTYQQTINKLKEFSINKTCKLQRFVEIMKSLASNIINKQEYLSLINQKMAIASVHIDKQFLKCEPYLLSINASEQFLNSVSRLKELFVEMREIYCEAEIFY